MKLAIIGSRELHIEDLERYIPEKVSEIVTGGAKGVDTSAMTYAVAHKIKLVTFLPDYGHYGRGAPLRRNIQIIEYADCVLAFWDGKSKGTRFVIDECCRRSVPICLYVWEEGKFVRSV